MGAGASVPAETELTMFKEMRARFEALKAEGKTDEDIYAELKTYYNTTAGASAATAPAADGDSEKTVVAPDASATATAAATPETETPASTPTGEGAATGTTASRAEGETAPVVAAETPEKVPPAAEGQALVEAAAAAE